MLGPLGLPRRLHPGHRLCLGRRSVTPAFLSSAAIASGSSFFMQAMLVSPQLMGPIRRDAQPPQRRQRAHVAQLAQLLDPVLLLLTASGPLELEHVERQAVDALLLVDVDQRDGRALPPR